MSLHKDVGPAMGLLKVKVTITFDIFITFGVFISAFSVCIDIHLCTRNQFIVPLFLLIHANANLYQTHNTLLKIMQFLTNGYKYNSV